MPPQASRKKREHFGDFITQAAHLKEHGKRWTTRVTGHLWHELDDDPPVVPPPGNPWDHLTLTGPVLWEVLGQPDTGDANLEAWMTLQLSNRTIIRGLMLHAVDNYTGAGTETPFMTDPLGTAQGAGARHDPAGGAFQWRDLTTILHMFERTSGDDHVNGLSAEKYITTTAAGQTAIKAEILRRVQELQWSVFEDKYPPGATTPAKIWNRNGFYCGCGRTVDP
jgi:hypothetical protein